MRNETARHLGLCGLLAAALLLPALADAAPAPWHLWRSKIDGARFCAQTSPGPGWERLAGPFSDLQCRTPIRAVSQTHNRRPPPFIDLDQDLPESRSKSSGNY